MYGNRDADFLCPFFRRIDRKTRAIVCEGVLPGSTVKSHFGSVDAMRDYNTKHCCDQYETCPWYRVAYVKYLDD